MGVPYTLYRTDTGEILGTGDCTDESECQNQLRDPENENVYIGIKADDATQYVNEEGDIIDRPSLNVSNMAIDADGTTHEIELPVGTTIIQGGEAFVVDDGISFATITPGTYAFDIVPPFPFVGMTLTIIAN